VFVAVCILLVVVSPCSCSLMCLCVIVILLRSADLAVVLTSLHSSVACVMVFIDRVEY